MKKPVKTYKARIFDFSAMGFAIYVPYLRLVIESNGMTWQYTNSVLDTKRMMKWNREEQTCTEFDIPRKEVDPMNGNKYYLNKSTRRSRNIAERYGLLLRK